MNQTVSARRRSLIFLNILIACIASSMLSTAMTTALLPISTDLGVSVTTGQWMTSGYSLAMGITMPLTAFLITRFPTKRLYLSGIGIFLVGLVISGFTSSFAVMMAGRVLQACGNGVLMSMAQVVLLTIYPDEQKGSIMGWYGLASGAAPVIAPTLAGVLVDWVGWRAIFYLALLIMALAFVFAVFVFDDVLQTCRKKFDALSFGISVLAFGGITLGIGNLGSYPLASPATLAPLAAGVAAAVLFTIRQLRLPQPFLQLRIFRSQGYTWSVVGSMLLYLVMMGSSVLMPLYVQSVMGYSATVSGLVTLPGSLAMSIVSPFAGKIFDRIGIKKLFVTGALFMLLSNVGMYFITLHTPLFVASLLNVVRCVAIGCLMMPLITWGTAQVDGAFLADASALLTSLRTIAGAIGSAVFVGLMSFLSGRSAAAYGGGAQMHGMNLTFLCMALGSLALLFVAVFLVHTGRERVRRRA